MELTVGNGELLLGVDERRGSISTESLERRAASRLRVLDRALRSSDPEVGATAIHDDLEVRRRLKGEGVIQ